MFNYTKVISVDVSAVDFVYPSLDNLQCFHFRATGAGDVVFVPKNNPDRGGPITLTIVINETYTIACKKIVKTGTTATGILALFAAEVDRKE